MDLQKTGSLIYNARKNLNLTQNELGSILGVTGKAVCKWEKGYSFPDVGLLPSLSETLSIPVSSLISGELDDVPSEKNTHDLVKISSSQSKKRKRIALAVTIPVAVILVAIIIIMSIFLAFTSMPTSAFKASSFSVSAFGSDTTFTADMRCYVGAEGSYGDCGSYVFTRNMTFASIQKSLASSAKKHGFSYDSSYSLFYKENKNKTVDYFYVRKVGSYHKNLTHNFILLATGLNAHLLSPSYEPATDEPICDFLLPLHFLADKNLLSPYLFIPSYSEYRTTATFDELCAFYLKTGYFTVNRSADERSATVVSNSLCAVSCSFGFDYLLHSGFSYVRFYSV